MLRGDRFTSFLQERAQSIGAEQQLLSGLSRQAKHRDWFRLAANSAGLPDSFVFQTLRAVATTRLIRSGVPAAEVQKLLSHKSIQTTLNHYHQADPTVAGRLRKLSLPKFQALQVPTQD